MADIFISYKREDMALASKLTNALKGEGWTVWWDPNLPAGEYFDEVIEKELNEAKCVLVLWSKLSVKSRYVRAEAEEALDKLKLIPIVIDNEVNLPLVFKRLQWRNLVNWDGSIALSEFRNVVEDIILKIGRPAAQTEEGGASPLVPLHGESWLQLEKMTYDGGCLLEDMVALATVLTPADLSYMALQQRRKNIDRNVRYVCLLPGRPESAARAAALLQGLLVAPFLQEDQDSFVERGKQLKTHKAEIVDSIKLMSRYENIKVYFVDELPNPEFAILNATDIKHCSLYFKHRSGLISWAGGSEAYDFWHAVRRREGLEYGPFQPGTVLRGTSRFELKGNEILKVLAREMEKCFPEISSEVLKLCLEGAPF